MSRFAAWRCWRLWLGPLLVSTLLVSTLLVSTLSPSVALAVTFSGPMAEAEWRLQASVFECRISHAIPQYGSAVFSARAGEEQRFYLRQRNPHLKSGEARIAAVNALWQPVISHETLGQVKVTGGEEPISMGPAYSQRLLTELQQGRRLLVEHASVESPVRLLVEPIGFRSAYTGYQNCLGGLLPVNYEQISRTAVYFRAGNYVLPEAEIRKLDQLVLYVRADSRISAVFVDGHTDGEGLRAANLDLSRERAELVSQYLVDRGVPANKITTRWHGERYPVASNREPGGRAQNRRVTIRVDRNDDAASQTQAAVSRP